jgi:branched-subunit amino acid ABC-type transport system permease component
MKNFWPFIITGLTSGSVYGIAAMGLVLTYKTSGIFNFAHGAVAAGAAYIFYALHVQHGVAWPIAGLLCVFVAAPLAGVIFERIARVLADVPPAAKIVASVGLLLVIQGTATGIYGHEQRSFPQFLPTHTYRLLGINVGAEQLIVVGIATVSAAGLYAFFRFSRLGVAMRGVVDNPELVDLAGTSPGRVRTQAWAIGNGFAALSGVLLAPTIGLDALLLTLLVVQAFGAAAVGAFTSLPLTYFGGLLVGVAAALSTKFVVDLPNLAGFPPSLPFLVLFVVLVFTRRGRFVEVGRRPRVSSDRQPLAPAWVWSGRMVLVAALVAVPQVVGARLPVYINAVIMVVIFLSLGLLVRTSGQVSLAHAGFMAIGAVAFSHLAHGAGLPWLVALLGAGLAAVPVGALVAIPAIRLSGVYLAVATFGFGILVERLAFRTGLMFGAPGFRLAPRPHFGGLDGDKGYYYVCLVAALAACVAIYALHRGRLGRLLRAMADSPVALGIHGANVMVTRVLVFCISAFLAGIAGALFAGFAGSISYVGFGAFQSLTWLTVLAIAGSGEFAAAFIAAALLAVVPSYVDNPTYTDWQTVIFGALAVAAALAQGGCSLANWFQRSADRHGDRIRSSPAADRMALSRNGARPPVPVGLVGAGSRRGS